MKNTAAATPFDQGNIAAKLGRGSSNPHAEGTVEHRNFELGRQFGLKNLKDGDTYRARGLATFFSQSL